MRGDIPYWGAGSIVDYVDDYLFDETLVLLGEDGAPFFDAARPVAHLVRGRVWVNNHIHVLRTTGRVLPQYLVHALNSVDFADYIDGSTRDKLTQGSMKTIRVPVPPVEVQSAIVDYLDSETSRLDALIDRKQRFIDLLLEKRTALITRAVTKGLDPDVEMKDSGVDWFGAYPARWQLGPLRHAIQRIEQGWSPQCESRPADDDEWGVLKAGAVNGGVYRPGEHKALPADLEPAHEYVLEPGDFIVSRANTRQLLGSAGVIPNDVGERRLLCDKLFRFVFAPDTVDPHFLAYLFASPVVRYQLERDATGASGSMQNIGQDTLRSLLVALPAMPEQVAIVAELDTRLAKSDELVEKTNVSIDLLREYRAALISAAVTGQIDIPGTETTEEVA
jgi:type I restriction enzyme S subunit